MARLRAAAMPLAVLGVLLAAALPRLWRLGEAPLWYDEAMYAWYGRMPLDMAWFGGEWMLAEPLFVTALHFWMQLGEQEWWLRLPSALAGIGVVALAMAVGGTVASRMGALFSGLLTAVSPMLVYYSRDAKMYSWVALLFLAAVHAGVCYAGRGGRGRLLAYAAAATALCYTHLLTPIYLAGTALIFLWPLRTHPRRMFAWLGANALVVLAAVPIIVAQWRHSQQMQGRGFHAGLPTLYDLWISFTIFGGGYTPREYLTGIAACLLLGGLALLAWRARRDSTLLAALASGVFPVALLFVLSSTAPWSLYVDRYLIGVAAVLPALCGAGLAQRRRGWLLLAAMLGVSLPLVWDAVSLRLHEDARRHKGVVHRMDARAMAENMRGRWSEGDTVLHVSWETLPVLKWYLPEVKQVLVQRAGELDAALLHLASPRYLEFYGMLPLDYASATAGHERAWVVAPWADETMRPMAESLIAEMEKTAELEWRSDYGDGNSQAELRLYTLGGSPPLRSSAGVRMAHGDVELELQRVAEGARLVAVNHGASAALVQYQAVCSAYEVAVPRVLLSQGWTQARYLAPGGLREAAVARVAEGAMPGPLTLSARLTGIFDVYLERTLTGRQHGVPGADLNLTCGESVLRIPAELEERPAGGWHWVNAGTVHLGEAGGDIRLEATGDNREAYAVWSRLALVKPGEPLSSANEVLRVEGGAQADDVIPCDRGFTGVMAMVGDAVSYLSLP